MTKATPSKGFKSTECHVITVGHRGDQSVRVFNSMGEMMTHLERVGAMPGGIPRKAAPRALVSLVVMGPGDRLITMRPV
jgi:hypothetical protein